MAELVELGFTGLDKFADRYWDQTYNHLPTLPRPGRKKRRQQQYQQRELPQGYSPKHPDKGYHSSRSSSEEGYGYQSEPDMYGPGAQDGYARGERYYETERVDYRAPGPGLRISREQTEYGVPRSAQVAAHAQPAQNGYGHDYSYSYSQQRPAPQRRRSSWSPPRSERRGRQETRRARSRSRSGSRSRSESSDVKHRLVATIGGALVGGLAGNQASKGSKYDTAATIAGAIIGGVGAREVSDHWDKARHKKKEQEENWREGEPHGNREGRRNERRHDGGYHDGRYHDDGRGYYY